MKRKTSGADSPEAIEINRFYRRLRRQIDSLGISIRQSGPDLPSDKLLRSIGLIAKTSAELRKRIRKLPRPLKP